MKEAEERRLKILEDREKAKQKKLDERVNTTEKNNNGSETVKTTEVKTEGDTKTKAQLIEENRLKKLAEREARKKALEDKKKKIIEDREKAKDSTNNN